MPSAGGSVLVSHLGAYGALAGKAVAGRRYIAGDTFTAADVYVGSMLGFGMQFG